MPCCLNQQIKPAMADSADEHRLRLEPQDRIQASIKVRSCPLKA